MAPMTVAFNPRLETTNLTGLGMALAILAWIGSISKSAERDTPPPRTTSSGIE